MLQKSDITGLQIVRYFQDIFYEPGFLVFPTLKSTKTAKISNSCYFSSSLPQDLCVLAFRGDFFGLAILNRILYSWKQSQNSLRNSLPGYNPQFGSNKIFHFFSRLPINFLLLLIVLTLVPHPDPHLSVSIFHPLWLGRGWQSQPWAASFTGAERWWQSPMEKSLVVEI